MTEVAPTLFYKRGDPEDLRLGDIVKAVESSEDLMAALHGADICIVGYPQDQGVLRNQGRVGAAKAPDIIRSELYRFCAQPSHERSDISKLNIVDLGNVLIDSEL